MTKTIKLPTTTGSTTHPALPTELWWICLSYLTRAEIQRLRHVSRFFAWLSFQVLFESLSWSTPMPAALWAPPLALEDAVDALQSFVAPPPGTDAESAAPAQRSVRNLGFRGLPRGLRTSLFSPRVNDAYLAYLGLFHDALSVFSGLRGLHLADITITDDVLGLLKALPALSALELSDCEIMCNPGDDWEPLHLQKFVVVQTRCCDAVYSRVCGMLVAPDQLERLVIADEQWASTMFNAWGTRQLPALRYLTIRVDCAQSAAFLAFLTRCPGLLSLFLAPDSTLEVPQARGLASGEEEERVDVDERETRTLSSLAIPLLNAYEGPIQAAPAFMIDRNIQAARLDIVSVLPTMGMNVLVPLSREAVLEQLNRCLGLPNAAGMHSLRVDNVWPDSDVLKVVEKRVPKLKSLEVYLVGDVPGGRAERPQLVTEGLSMKSSSSVDVQQVVRVAKCVGIPVDSDTGSPTEHYSSVECMLIWLTLGYAYVPGTIEELTLQTSESENPASRRMLPGGVKPPCASDIPKMLEHMSSRYTCLRRCRVGCRDWVRAVGNRAGVREWQEVL